MEKHINELLYKPEIDFEKYIKKSNINLRELLGYVLEHYGGSSSDLVFLKLFEKISKLTKIDWQDIFNNMCYNKLLAEESFVDFYMSYTNLSPSHTIFEFLNFSKRPSSNISNSFEIRKKIVYRSCNMTEKEIQKIESFDGGLWI